MKRFVMTNTMGVFGAIILISLIISSISKEFLTDVNFIVVARNSAIYILVGLAQMVVIAGGGLNVSVGAIGGLSAVISGVFMVNMGLPYGVAIALAIAAGALCGAINGFIIVRLGGTSETSWLTTLATASVYTGLILGLTNSKPFYDLPDGYIAIGSYNFFGILPLMLVIVLFFALFMWLIFKYTGIGRQILAVGGNQKAAALSGIMVDWVIIIDHILSAVLAASAGIIFASRLGEIHPTIGNDWMLFSFAAPLIGGTRLAGGYVNIMGAVLGAVVLGLISNAVVHLEMNIYLVELMRGFIIFAAVGTDRIREYREERRERLERISV